MLPELAWSCVQVYVLRTDGFFTRASAPPFSMLANSAMRSGGVGCSGSVLETESCLYWSLRNVVFLAMVDMPTFTLGLSVVAGTVTVMAHAVPQCWCDC